MKTENLELELTLYELDLWGNKCPIKYKIITATDIFSIEVYKKGLFGYKKIADGWNFSKQAFDLLKFLNNWLEYYKEEQ